MKRVILPLLVLFGISMLFALESEPSDVVGYIQYTINANDYEFVAVPFQSDLSTALDLANAIGSIQSVSFWNNDTSTWKTYIVGLPVNNFAVTEGHSYFVKSTNPSETVYYSTGIVGDPVSFDIHGGDFTQIMLPLNRSDLTTARALATDIGTSGITISCWNNGTFRTYIAPLPVGDFPISIGDGLFIDSNDDLLGWNSSTRASNTVRIESSTDNSSKRK